MHFVLGRLVRSSSVSSFSDSFLIRVAGTNDIFLSRMCHTERIAEIAEMLRCRRALSELACVPLADEGDNILRHELFSEYRENHEIPSFSATSPSNLHHPKALRFKSDTPPFIVIFAYKLFGMSYLANCGELNPIECYICEKCGGGGGTCWAKCRDPSTTPRKVRETPLRMTTFNYFAQDDGG